MTKKVVKKRSIVVGNEDKELNSRTKTEMKT